MIGNYSTFECWQIKKKKKKETTIVVPWFCIEGVNLVYTLQHTYHFLFNPPRSSRTFEMFSWPKLISNSCNTGCVLSLIERNKSPENTCAASYNFLSSHWVSASTFCIPSSPRWKTVLFCGIICQNVQNRVSDMLLYTPLFPLLYIVSTNKSQLQNLLVKETYCSQTQLTESEGRTSVSGWVFVPLVSTLFS